MIKESVRELSECFRIGKAFEFTAQAAVLGGGETASSMLFIRFKQARRSILKLRELAAEAQFDAPDRAITMLGYYDLGYLLCDGIFFLLVGTVDEHHNIRILFEGA
jgi:hypothetical protein